MGAVATVQIKGPGTAALSGSEYNTFVMFRDQVGTMKIQRPPFDLPCDTGASLPICGVE